ncbi:MAG: DUF3369 domain-containing protein [Spirochaetaceae bacterium]|nr:MAG: DUF3369 domain-containing protein [Spirochaetaceae bacterium]
MARINPGIPSGKKILLIDDQMEYLESTRALLSREGHETVAVSTGEEGLELLRKEHFDLLLVDYFMPHSITGEETVARLRKFNPYLQVILQTGYAGEIPPREMLKRLDIQGYHDKTDGPERLLMWVDIGLKAAGTVQLLYKSRLGLQYILDITPGMSILKHSDELFHEILVQATGLVGIFSRFLDVVSDGHDLEKTDRANPQGFIAAMDDANFMIQAATEKYQGACRASDCLDQQAVQEIRTGIQKQDISANRDCTLAPLCVGNECYGVIYLDQPMLHRQDIELLQVFVNHAAVAVQNVRLYDIVSLEE